MSKVSFFAVFCVDNKKLIQISTTQAFEVKQNILHSVTSQESRTIRCLTHSDRMMNRASVR